MCVLSCCVRHAVRVCVVRAVFCYCVARGSECKRACEIVAREKVREGRRSENTLICESATSRSLLRLIFVGYATVEKFGSEKIGLEPWSASWLRSRSGRSASRRRPSWRGGTELSS